MSLEELKKDAEEYGRLLGEAKRSRVRDELTAAKAIIEREIINLEMKARMAEERKTAGSNVAEKRYLVELNEYAWDQSDKFVKLFITLANVQSVDESQVTINFTDRSMILHVNGLNGKDYGLTINNLLEPIDVEKSYRKVKSDLIAVYMKKSAEGKHWEHLTTIQKRLKQKQDDEFKNDGDAEDALVSIMKKMYNQGDSKTKQMIAKAWTESQTKAMTGGNPSELN